MDAVGLCVGHTLPGAMYFPLGQLSNIDTAYCKYTRSTSNSKLLPFHYHVLHLEQCRIVVLNSPTGGDTITLYLPESVANLLQCP